MRKAGHLTTEDSAPNFLTDQTGSYVKIALRSGMGQSNCQRSWRIGLIKGRTGTPTGRDRKDGFIRADSSEERTCLGGGEGGDEDGSRLRTRFPERFSGHPETEKSDNRKSKWSKPRAIPR